MPDMAKFSKDTPAQARERVQWQLDAINANQQEAGWILVHLSNGGYDDAKKYLDSMHKSDRDAILQEGGILTSEQIEVLK